MKITASQRRGRPVNSWKFIQYFKISDYLTFANAKVPYFETVRSIASPPPEEEDLGGG